MSVHHPETSAAPRNPPSPDSATSSAFPAAIERAERAEAALAAAEEALQRAASYFGGCSTDRPFAAWNNVRGALAKIAALKGGEA